MKLLKPGKFGDGIIEFKTGNIDTVWGKRNELQIGVKRQDGSEAGYWFKYYDEKLVCYLMTESGETLEFYQKQVKLLKSYEYNMRIEIKKRYNKNAGKWRTGMCIFRRCI